MSVMQMCVNNYQELLISMNPFTLSKMLFYYKLQQQTKRDKKKLIIRNIVT